VNDNVIVTATGRGNLYLRFISRRHHCSWRRIHICLGRCVHCPYRIQRVENLHLQWLSHIFNITTFKLYAYQFMYL